ncbi:glycosyltransferase family 39 protein [Planosporangium flavigriseum]|nr:glycosyltransferase family 39 protein [Planosporangium flavigriseum]NJC67584.1 glycosyltransferase family 39 protein [Planosporangium flavigriseum]
MQQAWSVLRHGKLSPYTYFYDHAPLGWLTIAGWVAVIPGQFNSFGFPVNVGRALMVLVHAGCVFLLFEVVRRYSGSRAAATLAAFLFNVSPLAVYFQRMVLLDNLMVFWVLVGLYILARKDGRIVTAMGAGLAFGFALITKENAAFLLPGFGYLLHRSIVDNSNRRFSASFWWFAAGAPVSLYMLYAQIKNELLPANLDFNLASPPADHVSLLYTIWWQLNRTASGGQGTMFSTLLHDSWMWKDKYILITGTAATIANLVLSLNARRREVPMLGVGLLAIGYGFYLTRSVLLDFYVAPLVPLLALNIGLCYGRITRYGKPIAVALLTAIVCALPLSQPHGYLVAWDSTGTRLLLADQYRLPQTNMQNLQVKWIRENIPPDARLIIDDDIWVALREGTPKYPNAQSHFKAASDPDVRDKIFHQDWHNVDYVVMSNKMRDALQRNNEGWIMEAIDQHGEQVWRIDRGDVHLEIIKINNTG